MANAGAPNALQAIAPINFMPGMVSIYECNGVQER
jgi:hypothetical protein